MSESENIKFKCLVCGELKESLDEIEYHFEMEHPEELTAYDLVETETNIEESPEENPSDAEVITEAQLREKLAISKALEDYNEYEDLGKKEILQQGLNLTEDKTQGGRRLKGMPKRRTTRTAIKDEYQEILEKLSNEEMISCPVCNRLWTSIEKEMKEDLEKEELSWREMYPELEGKFPTIRLIHIKAKHVGIWEFIKDLFEILESERRYDDFHRDDSESCSQEELSKEELSRRIIESPELRANLFRRWKRELEKRD